MLKPQDIPILLKTHLWQDRQWRYSDLADSLGMRGKDKIRAKVITTAICRTNLPQKAKLTCSSKAAGMVSRSTR
jgi:hypothetical protein